MSQSEGRIDSSRRETSRGPRPGKAPEGLYRIAWRWHFYAGILVAPILLIVTATGGLYIFRSEIEDVFEARLRFVQPGSTRITVDHMVGLASERHPGLMPTGVELSADPRRAAVVRFDGGPDREGPTVYVDPYRGEVLDPPGTEEGSRLDAFFDAVLMLHRQLFLGTTGRILVELAVGWTILLLVTGLYLWWPRKRRKAAGVWWPRLRGKLYVVLRDLHTVIGFYFLVPALVIVATGLFYTIVWSEGFHQLTRDRGRPTAQPAVPPENETSPGALLSLQEVVSRVHDIHPDRHLFVFFPPKGTGRRVIISAGNDYNNTYGAYVSTRFEIDRADGSILSRTSLAEDERYWWHGWVYPLHVGSIYGPATKVLWLLACLVLCALPVTGLWMWWKRRPPGRSGFPRHPGTRLPASWVALVVASSILLPVTGASIVLILLGEWSVRCVRRAGRPVPGIATSRRPAEGPLTGG